VIIYLRQEGRGIGLFHKLQAYNLQDEGLDTLEANLHLGFAGDEREYTIAGAILQNLNINSINLLTNNPAKMNALTELGITVSNRVPLEVLPQNENRDYINTKISKMGHLNNRIVCKS
jgi:GTP cyclohydrolase II